MNELRVHAFHVGDDEKLLDGSIFAHVAFEFGMGVAPLFHGLTKGGDVEQIGLSRISDGRLRGRDLWRNQVRLEIPGEARRRFSSSLRRWNSLMR